MAVHSDLLKSGFVPNQEKSVWEPVQVITWLGDVLNTIDGFVQATDERIVKLTSDLGSLQTLSSRQSVCQVRVKSVASVAGLIISLSSCVESVTRIMTRHLFSVVNSASSWDSKVFLTDDFISEINFWANNVDYLNGRVHWGVRSLPVRVSFSDASDSACGAFVESNPELVFHQNWSPEERLQSSTWRELKAASLALEAFARRLSNARVIWYSDNQNVESILLNGSRKLDLQALALDAFQICRKYRISLDARWIPRNLNVRADSISKLVDFDDYAINDFVFQSINDHWGPHAVDRLACSYNSKLPRFNSLFFFQPGWEVVDAFSQDWGYDNNWLCPLVCLIVRVLKHMEVCLARGTLILPVWKSSFFWNVCATDGVHWSRFVIDWFYLPKFQGLFVEGKARNSLFGTRPLDVDIVALRVDFRRPRPPLCRGGFALCLMESVTLVIRRYFSLILCTPLREPPTMF